MKTNLAALVLAVAALACSPGTVSPFCQAAQPILESRPGEWSVDPDDLLPLREIAALAGPNPQRLLEAIDASLESVARHEADRSETLTTMEVAGVVGELCEREVLGVIAVS